MSELRKESVQTFRAAQTRVVVHRLWRGVKRSVGDVDSTSTSLVSRAVTLGERRGSRSRADGAGPSASVSAVACAPAEGCCLRLARPGRSRGNVDTLDVIH